jgi:hypothetical protein
MRPIKSDGGLGVVDYGWYCTVGAAAGGRNRQITGVPGEQK